MTLYLDGKTFSGKDTDFPIDTFFVSASVFLPHRAVGFALGTIDGKWLVQDWDNIKKEWRNR